MPEPDKPSNVPDPAPPIALNYRPLRDDRTQSAQSAPPKLFVYGCGIPLGFLYSLIVFVFAFGFASYSNGVYIAALAFLVVSAIVACCTAELRGMGIGIILIFGIALLLFGFCSVMMH